MRTSSPIHRIPGFNVSLVAASALAAGAVFLYRVDPRVVPIFHCPFHQLTGCDCPGCGAMRAGHCLLHGKIVQALDYNALMVLSLPVLAIMSIELLSRHAAWRLPAPWCITSRLAPWIPWIIIGYWILRNLPFFPFSLLSA